jgi:(p)ppGpp synthase/HD superfamily hydrolase
VADDDTMVAGGHLHDTVEDTNASIADIEKAFGADIAYLVTYVSFD